MKGACGAGGAKTIRKGFFGPSGFFLSVEHKYFIGLTKTLFTPTKDSLLKFGALLSSRLIGTQNKARNELPPNTYFVADAMSLVA